MYIEYNPNPYGKRAGDCVVRAITKAENSDWDTIYWRLALQGALMGDMPSSDNVWGTYLKTIGYKRYIVPNECPNCYTLKDFCEEYPQGTYLVKMPLHIATVIYGTYDGGSYDGNSYARRRRDSMGRYTRARGGMSRDGYSRDGYSRGGKEEMIMKIEDMMDVVSSDKERKALEKCLSELENS